MSVPLNRLYHYLDDVVNHDLVIYRWMPHGSRKLADLNQLIAYPESQWYNNPIAIFHDQEPLNYDFYTKDQLRNHAKLQFTKFSMNFMLEDSILDYVVAQHLRSATICINRYDQTILVHSEQNSKQVEYFGKENFIPVYYWSHAVIAQDWFRYAAHDPNLNFCTDNIKQDFLIYNRAWSGTREYRLMFVENLVNNKLIDHCKTTFCSMDQNLHYTNHKFANKKFIIENTQLENYFVTNIHSAEASADYVADDYAVIGIEVVLETLFDDDRWHLTEKTLRPIACGKPFILMATAGSLQYLRSYGFETFDSLINESYDLISDSRARLDAVVQEMKRIAALDYNAKQLLYTQLHEISQRNRQRFFNGLFDQVVQEYKTNLDHAMTVMNQHCTGVHRAEICRLLQQN
jgi:hypothetical protein